MLRVYHEKNIRNQFYVSADEHTEFDVDECSVSVMDLDNGFFIEEVECDRGDLTHTFCELVEKYTRIAWGV